MVTDKKETIQDFIYWLEKNNDTYEKKYTYSQIAQIIAKAMITFFDESDTPY